MMRLKFCMAYHVFAWLATFLHGYHVILALEKSIWIWYFLCSFRKNMYNFIERCYSSANVWI